MSKKPKSIVLTDPLDIAFMRWVNTLPLEVLPDLSMALQAIAERWPARQAYVAVLTFLRAVRYPDAERHAAELVRAVYGWWANSKGTARSARDGVPETTIRRVGAPPRVSI
jgi:hypothetical protein